MSPFLIYGATGYTGRLCAEHAVSRGLRPVLAGRSASAVRELAEGLGLEWRAFGLDDPRALRDGIRDMKAVLHAAGPFSATALPMAQACLAAATHYIDITGEIDVFEALATRDDEAAAARIMLLPGAGFDVVPSDCLAVHTAARLPGATRLRLSIGGFQGMSRGTAKTMLEGVAYGTRSRRGGRIVELAQTPRATADFGHGPRPTIGLGWGDVATAWSSTGVPEIDVFFQASPALSRAAAMPRLLKRLLATGISQRWLKHGIERRLPAGPTPEQRAHSQCLFLAEAWDARGRRVASRMRSPEGYTLTAATAVEIARRAATGDAPTGYQTPATAYGADFILSFDGIERVDL
ncbi:saccharopine dehydrogenase family protein [Methylobacterium gnaphalii]|uniref:saccharopine dehydrogenase family protein n=1 Tax=Methylobacterium gnaphalii TaxID=1010610 RepID=UPI00235C7119|nr:saccharopine dehydrogenase NADP-binding domain-containing protein [Methylobacterium gnaphalii]GLS51644.1 saccharopine dehydrogenase [Methylobacterium gnaphalii]